MRKLIIAVLMVASGCSGPGSNPEPDRQTYFFDLKSFFGKEAGRLSAAAKPVRKEVIRNNSVERSVLKIDWDTELALFRESDINKSAWKDSYRTQVSGDTTTYSATEDDLRTRKIILVRDSGGQVRHIRISNRTANFLYTTTETLDYYPDSGYRIDRSQSVRIIGTNHYIIKTDLK